MTNEQIQFEIEGLEQAIASLEKEIAYGFHFNTGKRYVRGETNRNRAQLRWFCERLAAIKAIEAKQKNKKLNAYKIVAVEREYSDQHTDEHDHD